ncbi:MAG: hypothetical protein EOO75_17645 [Myxococcales bacterium]|nr:MAG: hypothetical protein EOO75_17645 [Myxococcales bacterium]
MAACGNDKPPETPPPPPPMPVKTSAPVVEAPAPPKEPEPPPAPPVEFVEGTAAADPEKMPTVKFKAPTTAQVISVDKKGDYEVKLDVKDWPAPEGGRHVHLIVDNQPYKRIDDPKQPVKLKDIAPGYELAENQQHFLIAFASRSTHESIKPQAKGAQPWAIVPIHVGKKTEDRWKAKDPLLVYSRPKGANNGPPPAEGLLVDFYLVNAELGDGKFAVKATLKGPGAEGEGKSVTIKSWKPWRIKHPRTGTYSLQMTLLDKDGKAVPGAWNDVTHSFDVNLEAAPEAPHAGHGGPAPAGGPQKVGPSGPSTPPGPGAGPTPIPAPDGATGGPTPIPPPAPGGPAGGPAVGPGPAPAASAPPKKVDAILAPTKDVKPPTK